MLTKRTYSEWYFFKFLYLKKTFNSNYGFKKLDWKQILFNNVMKTIQFLQYILILHA